MESGAPKSRWDEAQHKADKNGGSALCQEQRQVDGEWHTINEAAVRRRRVGNWNPPKQGETCTRRGHSRDDTSDRRGNKDRKTRGLNEEQENGI